MTCPILYNKESKVAGYTKTDCAVNVRYTQVEDISVLFCGSPLYACYLNL